MGDANTSMDPQPAIRDKMMKYFLPPLPLSLHTQPGRRKKKSPNRNIEKRKPAPWCNRMTDSVLFSFSLNVEPKIRPKGTDFGNEEAKYDG